MRKSMAVLAVAALLFAGAGLVGCMSASGEGGGAGDAKAADCPFCVKVGAHCKDCKPGEPCNHCRECDKCPECKAGAPCANCIEEGKRISR